WLSDAEPISGKFGIGNRKFQLFVYTSKEGKLSEALVDLSTGKVVNVEPLTKTDDLPIPNRKAPRWECEDLLKRPGNLGSGNANAAVPPRKAHDADAAIVVLSPAHHGGSTLWRARTRYPGQTRTARRHCR